MILRAQNTPRKKAITVATRPVFKEIHRGLQFISFKNSVIVHSIPAPAFTALVKIAAGFFA